MSDKVHILCVDDDANILEGLADHLDRRFTMSTATSGPAGLAIVEKYPDLAVIMSDMQMPGMDGADFLARARVINRHATRVLLTGQASLAAAVLAVNEGHIFRFLTKPCRVDELIMALDAAVEQHRLVAAERVLLEQTLRGSVKTLTDVLALANPAAFGRANQVYQLAKQLIDKVGVDNPWQVEVAAMLCQLGSVVLPSDTMDRVYAGDILTDKEKAMVIKVPGITDQLLANIPRLEDVRAILSKALGPYEHVTDPQKRAIMRGAQIVKVACDFSTCESSGDSTRVALDKLRTRSDHYDPEVLQALVALRANRGEDAEMRNLRLHALAVGMILAEDIKTQNNTLFVARGFQVTPSFLERLRNLPSGTLKEPVRVILPGA